MTTPFLWQPTFPTAHMWYTPLEPPASLKRSKMAWLVGSYMPICPSMGLPTRTESWLITREVWNFPCLTKLWWGSILTTWNLLLGSIFLAIEINKCHLTSWVMSPFSAVVYRIHMYPSSLFLVESKFKHVLPKRLVMQVGTRHMTKAIRVIGG